MKKNIVAFLLIIFSNLYVFGQNNDIVIAINKNAFKLNDSNPNIDIDKDARLDSIFEKVRIFGFGEATHGTKEFFNLKFKFFKYLVINQGVRNFAIEASYANCIAINNYIKGQESDPKELLKNIGLWTWNTQEVLELIEWMKKYNIDKIQSKQINFYGIDIMDCSNSARIITEHLTENSYKNKIKYLDILSHYTSTNSTKHLNKNLLNSHLIVMAELKEILKSSAVENKELYISLQNSIIQYINLCIDYRQEIRDKEMSENINQILDNDGNESKIFIWAHNFHIKKNKITYTNEFSMGHFLKEKYGNEYYSLGFDFATGEFNAYSIKNKKIEIFSITEPMSNTSSELFNKSSFDYFFLDFNSISKINTLEKYINSKVKYRGIGSTYNPKMIENEKLTEAYDGMIFIKDTKASTLLFR
ncbi:erythromycin esterase family protein [Flavobacterium muglaense]|uniref:Erythromycin esterase family protein n=1 Tax=Flavobacterium muglaense TaxID=2764716 RepID=A0A923N528_9FLAO|nr:erythromycin esterase family protein [Flavobacterium muglaense]MBC5839623.1 erythromycin esterase family protein [Flavobacterium muglaense]MBC5846155.1 erythromycin esterase family protein [Flavobacterium muglaense]